MTNIELTDKELRMISDILKVSNNWDMDEWEDIKQDNYTYFEGKDILENDKEYWKNEQSVGGVMASLEKKSFIDRDGNEWCISEECIEYFLNK